MMRRISLNQQKKKSRKPGVGNLSLYGLPEMRHFMPADSSASKKKCLLYPRSFLSHLFLEVIFFFFPTVPLLSGSHPSHF